MILDNRAIIAWIIWMKMRIWNQTCQKPKNQSSINGEKKWNSQRKLFHHNALALWEMFRFRPKISFTNFRLNFEHFNETWKAELRELKKVSVKDKIAAFSSKVEEKPVKKKVHYNKANGEAHLFVKLVIDWPSFIQSECCFNYPMNSSPVKISTCTSNNFPL